MKNKWLLISIAISIIALRCTFTNSRNGSTYKTVIIGSQTWMAENLKTSRYNDGTAIPLVIDADEWSNLTTPGYCWYNNDTSIYTRSEKYGVLYNWYTVNTGKLCPKGWHVPTDSDWITLATYLGGESVAGSKLKETFTYDWKSPNDDATNESGFTALPGGYRLDDGQFDLFGQLGGWWSATDSDVTMAWSWYTHFLFSSLSNINSNKTFGYSVRCIKDK